MNTEEQQRIQQIRAQHRMTAFAFEGQEPPQAHQDIDFLLSIVKSHEATGKVSEGDEALLASLRKERADQDDFWTFYKADPLMVKAAERIEELLAWHGTERSMHAAWRKRAEEAETALIAIQKGD